MNARRPWARALVPLYAAAIRVKDWLRGAGLLRTRVLRWPVVSVGSLSAGGAGKTPVVIAVAKLLRDGGWTVDVLSRGYGREGWGMERVEPELDYAARRFGDEPLLIAEQTGVPVWVGANRYVSGKRAEKEAEGDARGVHLLDDGFQHRQLARSVDIVLVTAEDLEDTLLPAGNLREGLSALQRADVLVVRQNEVDADIDAGVTSVNQRAWKMLRERGQMWIVRRKLLFPAPLRVFGAGLRPVAFCAIARPEDFAAMLQDAGCGVVETVAFADHHRYTAADMNRVIEVAKNLNGSGFITTEKDAVKLTEAMRRRLEGHGPLMVVALEAEFADPAAVLRALEAKLLRVEAKA
ncbi:MAG TPA: tetraacyldisaccharide 4'-kinase [Acidobacteriaceae bacterium]|nr:tetraacyldisaccharide 4'-kinase [Acidobacteriaceae bacterium]